MGQVVERPLVYIAGPLSGEKYFRNALHAMRVGFRLWKVGFTPLVPHLSLFWNMFCPAPYEVWLAIDFELLARCDAVLRLKGPSPGADREIEQAKKLGIPVFYSLKELDDWRLKRART